MAKARPVVSDSSSNEVDELRRQFNNLLVILERVGAEVVATTLTAEEALQVVGDSIAAGVDTTTTSGHVPTGREINGVKPTPTHPRRPRVNDQDRVVLDSGSTF
jgi:hypothetical protein